MEDGTTNHPWFLDAAFTVAGICGLAIGMALLIVLASLILAIAGRFLHRHIIKTRELLEVIQALKFADAHGFVFKDNNPTSEEMFHEEVSVQGLEDRNDAVQGGGRVP